MKPSLIASSPFTQKPSTKLYFGLVNNKRQVPINATILDFGVVFFVILKISTQASASLHPVKDLEKFNMVSLYKKVEDCLVYLTVDFLLYINCFFCGCGQIIGVRVILDYRVL